MNPIAEFKLDIIRLLLQPDCRRTLTNEEIRTACMTLYSRPQPLSQLAKAIGLKPRALYMRFKRRGIPRVGIDAHGESLYWPTDLQKVDEYVEDAQGTAK